MRKQLMVLGLVVLLFSPIIAKIHKANYEADIIVTTIELKGNYEIYEFIYEYSIFELKRKAFHSGGDAVIGLRIASIIDSEGKTKIMYYGTLIGCKK